MEEKVYAWKRLSGKTGDRVDYILTIEDDCNKEFYDYLLPISVPDLDYHQNMPEVYLFHSLREALWYLKDRYGEQPPCPEHARILIWEVLPSGHRKVVWHFSGWHYDYPLYTDLPQGTLPGDWEPLYCRALDQYTDLAAEYYGEEE